MKWLGIRVAGSLIMSGAFVLEITEGESKISEFGEFCSELGKLWRYGLGYDG